MTYGEVNAFFSADDLKQLVRCLEPEGEDIAIFAAQTGMRLGEILKLRWEDIDLTERLIYVRDSKNSDPRVIPMTTNVSGILKSLTHESDYVFALTGRAKRVNKLRRIFESARKEAQLTHLRFHDLRRTFASQCACAGADIFTLQELMGHRTLEMTRRYARLAPQCKWEAIKRLPQLGAKEIGTKMAQKLTQEKSPGGEGDS